MKKFLLAGAALAALASGAQAADLGSQRVAVPAAIIAPAFSWTGFYVGAHIGWGWNPSTVSVTDLAGRTFSRGQTGSGVFGGGQIGYNWQVNQFVLGAEADIAGAGLNKSSDFFGIATVRTSTTFLSSVRARAGFAVDRALFYVTGGLGIATFSNKLTDNFGVVASNSSTRAGWTLGGGLEYAFLPNWTAKVEYLYYGFGDRTTITDTGLAFRTSQNVHSVKLGVNYLFSTGGVRY
jgi:outer membrane immunogenic protein